MKAISIRDFTRELAPNFRRGFALRVKDEKTLIVETGKGRRVHNLQKTYWWPSREELALLDAGGCIELVVIGKTHPTVALKAADLPKHDGLPETS